MSQFADYMARTWAWWLWPICAVLVGFVGLIRTFAGQRPEPRSQYWTRKAEAGVIYAGLRNRALGYTSDGLGLPPCADDPGVFGVLMDWSSEAWTATVVALLTGDVSLYLSNGGGVLGGISHVDVRSAAFEVVRLAQKHLPAMAPTTTFPLPPAGNCRFYVLTNRGVFTAEEAERTLASGASPLADLGSAAQKALNLLRSAKPAGATSPLR